jgi:hypothetical protein
VPDHEVIEVGPDGRVVGRRTILSGRRIPVAAAIAMLEVLALIVWRPSLVVFTLTASLVLVLALWASFRLTKPGLLRDVLWVVALSQGMVVAIPLVLGASLVAAIVVGVLLLLGALAVMFRSRTGVFDNSGVGKRWQKARNSR